MSVPATPPDTRAKQWLGRAGVVLAGIGFVLVGDLPGLGAAVLLGIAWYGLPAPYAVAIGHALFVALLPTTPGALEVVPAELGLLCILGGAAPSRDGIARFGALLLTTTVLLAGIAALGFQVGGLTGGAFALVAVSLLGGYGLHRYELLRLGLLEDADPGPDATTGPNDSPDTHTDTTTEL